jgi:hypothetical protein
MENSRENMYKFLAIVFPTIERIIIAKFTGCVQQLI